MIFRVKNKLLHILTPVDSSRILQSDRQFHRRQIFTKIRERKAHKFQVEWTSGLIFSNRTTHYRW